MRSSILTVLFLVAFAPLARAEEGPKILVVFMQRVIDETTEGKKFVKKLNEEMAAEKKRLTEEASKLQEKVNELAKAQLTDRTPEFYAEYNKAMEHQARLEMDKNLFLLKKQDEIARATNELIRGAQTEARAIMKRRGAEIVLISRMGPLKVNNDKEFQQELIFRRVLCATDDVDITDEVIERMNKWYAENKKPSSDEAPKRMPGKVTPAKKEGN